MSDEIILILAAIGGISFSLIMHVLFGHYLEEPQGEFIRADRASRIAEENKKRIALELSRKVEIAMKEPEVMQKVRDTIKEIQLAIQAGDKQVHLLEYPFPNDGPKLGAFERYLNSLGYRLSINGKTVWWDL
jgi:hypothetical protein